MDSIWHYHVRSEAAGLVKAPSDDVIRQLAQCEQMTEVARKFGAAAEGWQIYGNENMSTPLFAIIDDDSSRSASQIHRTLGALLRAGYDIESRNAWNRTPLLWGAVLLAKHTLRIIDFLLLNKANAAAVDEDGNGVLHLCLNFSESLHETFIGVCETSLLRARVQTIPMDNPDEDTLSAVISDSEVASSDGWEGDDIESMCGVRDIDSDFRQSRLADGWSGSCYYCEQSPDEWESDITDLERLCHCSARDIDSFDTSDAVLVDNDFLDAEPEPWMCKTRVRLKLLRFLRAGCDPNLFNDYGQSPSDYARSNGLWPQWKWALDWSGWMYDQAIETCVRQEEGVRKWWLPAYDDIRDDLETNCG